MAIGTRIRCRDKEPSYMPIKTFMKVNLIMIKPMGLESMNKHQEKYMKDIGLKISLMEKESKHLQMAQYMKVNSLTVPNMAKVITNGSTIHIIKVAGLLMSLMAMENTHGLTEESILEAGRRTSCMVKVLCIMKMVESTLDSTNSIKNTALVFINGPTVKFMMEAG